MLNASKDVNDLEIELDNLKDTNGLFKKVLEVIRRLALEKDEKDEGICLLKYFYSIQFIISIGIQQYMKVQQNNYKYGFKTYLIFEFGDIAVYLLNC